MSPTAIDQRREDVRAVLSAIEQCEGRATQGRIRDAVLPQLHGGPNLPLERFAAAWSLVQTAGYLKHDMFFDSIQLSAAGQRALQDGAQVWSLPTPTPVTVAELRAAVDRAAPLYADRAEARRQSRLEAQRREIHEIESALGFNTLAGRWRVVPEPDPDAANLCAIVAVEGELVEIGSYLRARLDREQHVIWFWASTADRPGIDDWLPIGANEDEAMSVFARVLLHALEALEDRPVEPNNSAPLREDLLHHVRVTPGASRRDLARAFRLSVSDIDAITAELESRGEIVIRRTKVPGGTSVRLFPVSNGWATQVSPQVSQP